MSPSSSITTSNLLPCVLRAATQEIKPSSRPSSGNLMMVVYESRKEVFRNMPWEHWVPYLTQRSLSLAFGEIAEETPTLLRAGLHLAIRHQAHFSPSSHTMAPVQFWSAPLTYLQWAARRKPAIFWSFVVGSLGPITVVCQAPLEPRPHVTPHTLWTRKKMSY